MTEFEYNIAYEEGKLAYSDGVYCSDCPYYGVSDILSSFWEGGWWDMFYAEIE